MAQSDLAGPCPDTYTPQCQSAIPQDIGQSLPPSGNFCRPTPGCPANDQQQQTRHFYTGDISEAYDEACNFWSFLDQELEPKLDIKVERRSPCWPEADSTSRSPYGTGGRLLSASDSRTSAEAAIRRTERARQRRLHDDDELLLLRAPAPTAAASPDTPTQGPADELLAQSVAG
ncbi:hypothetical protein MRX96_036057 [Rhipicephalus microplus]